MDITCCQRINHYEVLAYSEKNRPPSTLLCTCSLSSIYQTALPSVDYSLVWGLPALNDSERSSFCLFKWVYWMIRVIQTRPVRRGSQVTAAFQQRNPSSVPPKRWAWGGGRGRRVSKRLSGKSDRPLSFPPALCVSSMGAVPVRTGKTEEKDKAVASSATAGKQCHEDQAVAFSIRAC